MKITEVGNNAKRNLAIVVLSNYLGLRAKKLAAVKIGDVVENDGIKRVQSLFIESTAHPMYPPLARA